MVDRCVVLRFGSSCGVAVVSGKLKRCCCDEILCCVASWKYLWCIRVIYCIMAVVVVSVVGQCVVLPHGSTYSITMAPVLFHSSRLIPQHN